MLTLSLLDIGPRARQELMLVGLLVIAPRCPCGSGACGSSELLTFRFLADCGPGGYMSVNPLRIHAAKGICRHAEKHARHVPCKLAGRVGRTSSRPSALKPPLLLRLARRRKAEDR